MDDYMYLLAIIVGILIVIILKRKDILEILQLRRDIKKMRQSM